MNKKNICIMILLVCIVIIGSSCGKEIGKKTLTTITTTTETYGTDGLLIEESSSLSDSSISDSSSIIDSIVDDSSSKVEKKSKKANDNSVVSVEVQGPMPTIVQEEVVYEPVYEAEPSQIEEEEYIVYKPSTHYIHRSSCHWVTDECYEITDTSDIEARKCEECNPDIEIVNKYVEPVVTTTIPAAATNSWSGEKLSPWAGVVYGPSGKETYYNLNMSGVVSIMRGMGFDEANYPYWVRDDGCKMLGSYIMVAANLDVHPRGSLVECSLGTAIVCDTGGFAYSNANQLDVATTW